MHEQAIAILAKAIHEDTVPTKKRTIAVSELAPIYPSDIALLAVGGFDSVFAEVVAVEEGLRDGGAFCAKG